MKYETYFIISSFLTLLVAGKEADSEDISASREKNRIESDIFSAKTKAHFASQPNSYFNNASHQNIPNTKQRIGNSTTGRIMSNSTPSCDSVPTPNSVFAEPGQSGLQVESHILSGIHMT